MNIYLTSGTFDFLKKIRDKHPNEKMILMQNSENSVLLHETSGKTLFNAPRAFEVIDTAGTDAEARFVVLNNIPVTDEDKPLFEYHFKNKGSIFKTVQGFIAMRALRPLKGNTYMIITFWKSERTYKDWENSPSHKQFFSQSTPSSAQTQMFMGNPYTSKYYIPEEA